MDLKTTPQPQEPPADSLGFSFVTPDWKAKLKAGSSHLVNLYNAAQDFIVPKYYHDRSYR